jgi:O-antigen/teichoic acid export membrane protein
VSTAEELPPTSEVTSGRLLRNTLANGLANASNALVTAILTPFLLHRLGTEQYGIWLLALGITFSSGYLAFADLGLSDAAVKFIAEARALGSTRVVSQVASTTIAVFAAVGLVAGAAGVLLTSVLVRIFDVAPHLVGAARLVFVLVALQVIVELPVTALRAVVEGAQRYAWLRTLDVGGRVAWAGLVILALSQGHGVVSLAAAALGVTVIQGLATVLVAHHVERGLRLRPSEVDRAVLRRTMSYGSVVGGLRILSVVYSQMDRVIVGVALSVASVATYEVAFRVQSLATLFMVMASSAVLPAAAYNAARADTHKQREMYLRGTKYAIGLVLPITVAAALYAKPIIEAWVGPEYGSVSGAARLFLVIPIFGCVHQVGIAMLVGLGQAKGVLRLQSLAVALNLVLSLLLVRHMGISGVILGTLIGGLVVWGPYLRLLLATFEVGVAEWARRVVLPNLPGVTAQVAVGFATLHWASRSRSLWQVGLLCAASGCVHLICFAAVGLGREERRHLAARLVRGSSASPS